jgi:hypothetical protein
LSRNSRHHSINNICGDNQRMVITISSSYFLILLSCVLSSHLG